MANAFIALSVPGSDDATVALELAINTAESFAPLFAQLGPPMVRRGIRMYETHGFGKWEFYEHEPGYEAAKGNIFERELTLDDLLRWDDQGAGDHTTSTSEEVLHPSLTNEQDTNFYLKFDDTTVELGTFVPWGYDIEHGGPGPDWSGAEFAPPRSLTDMDDEFKEDIRLLLSRYAATIAAQVRGTRAGLTKDEVRDRIAGIS